MIVYKTNESIKIDGKATESSWEAVEFSRTFVDIEGEIIKKPTQDTRMKMLWDDDYIYVYAYMDEEHVWAKLHENDTVVFYDDDFEVFIDPDGDSHNYTEIEVNAINTVWDLMLHYPYRIQEGKKVLWRWNMNGLKTATHIDGTLNNASDIDKGWGLEMAIPMDALLEFSDGKVKEGTHWRINFSRVDWPMVNEGSYIKKKDSNGKILDANNWVWSAQGKIAMHMPEVWGTIQFTEKPLDVNVEFIEDPNRETIDQLWKYYHKVVAFGKVNDTYNAALVNEKRNAKCVGGEVKLHTTPYSFDVSLKDCNTGVVWVINERGRLFKGKK